MAVSRWRWAAAAAVFVAVQSSGANLIAVPAASLALAQSAEPSAQSSPAAQGKSHGLLGEQKMRQLQRKEFLREHSDSTGQVRPDLELKGIQHMHQMKVAPSLGAHSTAPSPAPSPAPAPK